ncbi:hypothetical protein CHARACLAT_003195 [Characodon lateralis]|uniref:Uncharacterized protein n=1 Tax=Characodon lateralis TaxID=208331 RepID=A0ABU7EZT3_9TELE|nr:hypothetical protein [Characodon lateralis]
MCEPRWLRGPSRITMGTLVQLSAPAHHPPLVQGFWPVLFLWKCSPSTERDLMKIFVSTQVELARARLCLSSRRQLADTCSQQIALADSCRSSSPPTPPSGPGEVLHRSPCRNLPARSRSGEK